MITVIATEPKWDATGYDATIEPESYMHEIRALGGYWQASFTVLQDVEDWIQSGLGRHIEVYDDALTKVWEGFVDQVDANVGPLAVTRGPLLDVANKVSLIYSTMDTSVDPPTVGMRTETSTAQDTDSQALYSVRYKILSAGGMTQTEAEQVRDTFLNLRKNPKTTKAWSSQQRSQPAATVTCRGYVHMLDYPYSETGTTGDRNADTKITDILDDDENFTWNTDYVDENTIQVRAYENDDRLAWAVIKEVTAQGDADEDRWLFGIYNDLEAWYEEAPTTLEYYQRLSSQDQRVEKSTGERVYPWNVRPGKWLLFPDFLIGATQPANLREDPRAMFIEGVTYTAPWGLSIRGGDSDTLTQLLAQLGLAGIGA